MVTVMAVAVRRGEVEWGEFLNRLHHIWNNFNLNNGRSRHHKVRKPPSCNLPPPFFSYSSAIFVFHRPFRTVIWNCLFVCLYVDPFDKRDIYFTKKKCIKTQVDKNFVIKTKAHILSLKLLRNKFPTPLPPPEN